MTTTPATPTAPTDRDGQLPIPAPLRQLFAAFPLKTYPAAPLPARCPRPSPRAALYLFTTTAAARLGLPSFNPACLKWQAYLKMCGVPFDTVASNNHASPSGALPFLVPPAGQRAAAAVPAAQLARYAAQHSVRPPAAQAAAAAGAACDMDDPLVKAALALVDTRVRDAWLYAVYMEPHNFEAIARPQYCATTAVGAVNRALAAELSKAAAAELTRTRPGTLRPGGPGTAPAARGINADDIYADADEAFAALATLLGHDAADRRGAAPEWFFGAARPGLLDAAVFAYTHLILAAPLHSTEAALGRSVRRHANLVAHEKRVRQFCGWD